MAVLTGLFQRGSSYYLRVVLPLLHPLQTKYKNGEFVVSLGPCSYRDAVQRGTVQRTGLLYGTNPQGIRLAPSLVYQVVSKSTKHSLRDIHGLWTTSKARSKDTVSACLRAVCLYEEFTGNLPIENLTRELGGTDLASEKRTP